MLNLLHESTSQNISDGSCPQCGLRSLSMQLGGPCRCGWIDPGVQKRIKIRKRILLPVIIGGLILAPLIYKNYYFIFPDDSGANAHLSAAKDLVYNSEDKEAVAEFKQAIALNPRRSDLRYELAQTLFSIGEPNQGLDEIRIAASLAPDDYQIQEVCAEALNEYGHEKASLEQFDKVVQRFKDKYICRQQAAIAYESAGNDTKAISLWKEALVLKP